MYSREVANQGAGWFFLSVQAFDVGVRMKPPSRLGGWLVTHDRRRISKARWSSSETDRREVGLCRSPTGPKSYSAFDRSTGDS
jgi:hypothetical protein